MLHLWNKQIKNDIMISRSYKKPTIEIEVLAVEQGFLLSTDFEVPGGGNYGDENDNWA